MESKVDDYNENRNQKYIDDQNYMVPADEEGRAHHT